LSDELDPSERLGIDQLQEQYQRRHGVSVEYVKAMVGPGDEYFNQAARVVISPSGAWFECVDLPMEFSGAAGASADYHFVSDAGAMDVFTALYDAIPQVNASNSRRYGLFALYTRTGIADGRGVYAYQFEDSKDGVARRPHVIGEYKNGVLPLVFRARLDTDLLIPGLSVSRGVVFCLTGIGERNLVVAIPYSGEDMLDLANTQENPITQ
jgi:hypothetical protein